MIHRTANRARTLPGQYYTSEVIFREELERVFGERWLYAGHISQLPEAGSYFLLEIGPESIIVVRDAQGEIRAFYNVCRHRGTRLCSQAKGEFPGRIQCPYHAWTFALDGRLIGAPNMNGVAEFDRSNYPLHSVPLVLWEGFLFLNLSRRPKRFEDTFATLWNKFTRWQIPEMQAVHRIQYDLNCNWKLVFQNYSECYHCPRVHPALAKLTPYRGSVNYLEEGPFLGGPMEMTAESMTMDGRSCAMPLPGLNEEDFKLVYYYTIFPTMFLTLHPDYVLVHRCEPQTPEKTRVICEWFFRREAVLQPDFDPGTAVEFWDLTNRQDWHVCELSQKGIRSKAYTPGPYSDLESLLAAFDREYFRAMGHVSPELALAR